MGNSTSWTYSIKTRKKNWKRVKANETDEVREKKRVKDNNHHLASHTRKTDVGT